LLKKFTRDLRESEFKRDQFRATLLFGVGVIAFAVIAGFLFKQHPEYPPAGRMGIVSDFPESTWFNTGGPLSLFSELRGHIVVMLFNDFNALSDLEDLTRLYSIDSTFADLPVICIVVSAGRETEETRFLVQQWQIQLPVIADPDSTVMNNFSVRALPAVLIIDTASRTAARYYQGWHLIPLEDVIYDLIDQGITTRSLATERYDLFSGNTPENSTE